MGSTPVPNNTITKAQSASVIKDKNKQGKKILAKTKTMDDKINNEGASKTETKIEIDVVPGAWKTTVDWQLEDAFDDEEAPKKKSGWSFNIFRKKKK